jgi:hypothetical protein
MVVLPIFSTLAAFPMLPSHIASTLSTSRFSICSIVNMLLLSLTTFHWTIRSATSCSCRAVSRWNHPGNSRTWSYKYASADIWVCGKGPFIVCVSRTESARSNIESSFANARFHSAQWRLDCDLSFGPICEVIYAASLKTLSQLRRRRVTQGKDKHHESNSSCISAPRPWSSAHVPSSPYDLRTMSFLYATPAARSRLSLTWSSYGRVIVHRNLYARCCYRSLAKPDRHNWAPSST